MGKKHKIILIIVSFFALLILLPTFYIGFSYYSFKYLPPNFDTLNKKKLFSGKLSDEHLERCKRDYAKAEQIIADFPNELNPALNVPKEQNGQYYYWKAARAVDKMKSLEFERKNNDRILDEILKNPSKIKLSDTDIFNIIKDAEPILKIIKEGNEQKYFEYNQKVDGLERANRVALMDNSLRAIVKIYCIKADCEINSGKYDEAVRTYRDCAAMINNLSRDNICKDKMNMLGFVVTFAHISILCDSLDYFTGKTNKPYPEILNIVKSLKQKISVSAAKDVLKKELSLFLMVEDLLSKGQKSRIIKKDSQEYIFAEPDLIKDIPVFNYLMLSQGEAVKMRFALDKAMFVQWYDASCDYLEKGDAQIFERLRANYTDDYWAIFKSSADLFIERTIELNDKRKELETRLSGIEKRMQ